MADEVESTTRNKTVKKAQSQLEDEGRLLKRGIGTETPMQQQFRKQVETTVTDPTTRKDVLKAAGIKALPGHGMTSKPPTKPTPKAATKPSPQDRTRQGVKRYRDLLRAAGVPEKHIEKYIPIIIKRTAQLEEFDRERRAERREKFLRRQAAEKYGTPP